MEAVDVYVDENRVKGNSLVSDARLIAEEIKVYIQVIQQDNQIIYKERYEAISAAGKKVAKEGNKVIKSANVVVKQNEELVVVSIVILITILIFSVLFSFVLQRVICRPIMALRQTVETIQKSSDLTLRVDVTSMDEVGQTGIAFNAMIEQFSNIIKQVSDACLSLGKATAQLSQRMQQTQISLIEQQDETAQVATAVTQMTTTLQSVAENTAQASLSTTDAKEVSSNGRNLVNVSISSTHGLSNLIQEANINMIEVNDSSAKIGSVLDVIRGISEQTNLLALNAAIEAARAGDAGRGFAVVADEVRTLAQRTQESTIEINTIISNLQEGTKNVLDIMSAGNNDAQKVSTQAEETGIAFQTIENKINEINDLNFMIATAAEEQSTVTDEINEKIININDNFTVTALAVEETVDASEDLMKLSTLLESVVNQFTISK